MTIQNRRYSLTTIVLIAIIITLPMRVFAAPCEYPDDDISSEQTSNTSITYSDEIYLSEIYPAPGESEEEFIELYNASSESIDIAGWIIADASGKKYTISESDSMTTVIDDGGYFVIPQSISSLYLNNSGDSVYLYHPDETLVDSSSYDSSETGESWSLLSHSWEWTQDVTEGSENSSSNESTTVTTEHEENESENSSGTDDTVDESLYETSEHIVLSELLPNPTGLDSTDEWIEIVNTGTDAVFLGGWKLTDETTYYTIGDITLDSGEYFIFEVSETGISLNNSGDTVYLIDPFEVIIHGTTYTSAIEGQSWNDSLDSDWYWGEPTPGDENMTEEVVSEQASDDEETTEHTGEYNVDTDVVSIDVFRSLEDNITATIEGIVSVLPGTLGSQYFYIQDDSSGIQVYSHKKTFPDISVGDAIQITGVKSQSRGETRIKITSADQIVILSSGNSVLARDVSALEESLEGVLVQVSGEIVERSSTSAVLNDSIQIALKKSTGIPSDLLEEGKQTTIIGIVSQQTDAYRLLPRSEEDITIEEGEDIAWVHPAEASTGTTAATQLAGTDTQQSLSESVLLISVIIGLLLIIAGYKWREYQKKETTLGKTDATTESTQTEDINPSSGAQTLLELLQQKKSSSKIE